MTNPRAALVEDLVAANRILFSQGVVDAFGHVSARSPERPDRFLLSRSLAPERVRAEDILEFDLDCDPVDGAGAKLFLERYIHGEIYRARPDVMGVVHSHSHAIVPLGVVAGAPLRAVFHMGGFIGAAAPVFEIRTEAGDGSDLLIRTPALGAALARTLGDGPVVLMRGHGSTVVGSSLREAVFHAVYAEVNARLQCQAMQLGTVTYLTPSEASAAAATNAGQADRAWDFWSSQVAQTKNS